MKMLKLMSSVAALALAAGMALGSAAFAQSGNILAQRGQDRGKMDTRGSAEPRERLTVDMLYERVRPEGEFVEIRGLGRAWKPTDVDAEWRPYTRGRWIFNERVGWYFESDEPWAEITYHYGRWYDDPDEGWVWIADVEWAPAWVEWRRSRSHVGWRPLPPRNAPRVARSSRSRQSVSIEEEWVFVPADRITEERVVTVIVERPRVRTIYEEARPIGRVERRGGITVNFGIDPEVLRRESNVTIRPRNLPRVEAVPVPQEVRSISTETRSTTDQPRRRDDDRDAMRPKEAAPSRQPAGTATTPPPRTPEQPPSDTARQPGTEDPGAAGARRDRPRPDAAPSREGRASPGSAEPTERRRPPAAGMDTERRVQPDRAGDAQKAPVDRQRPQRAEEFPLRRNGAATVPARREPSATERQEPAPAAQQRRQGPGAPGAGEATRRPQEDRGPGAGPGPGRSRAGDEATGAVSRPQSPGQGRPPGPEGASSGGQGRDKGPQRKLPPGHSD